MKKIIMAIFLFTNIYAKPVQTTSLQLASLKAPLIVIATTENNQLDYLKINESIEVDTDALWQEYKIEKILYTNNKQVNIEIGATIKLDPKSNGCIRFKTKVKRESDTLIYTKSLRKGEKEISTHKIKPKNKKKVILFLETNYNKNALYKFNHYGWLLSPLDYTHANIKMINKTIKTR